MSSDAHEIDPAFFKQVLGSYDSVITRTYLRIRFSIISRILGDLLGNLPHAGTVVNLGSGIGLFDLYGAHHRPGVTFIGIDIDAARIASSREAARRLNLTNVTFVHGDVAAALPDVTPTVIVALDLLHHLDPAVRDRVLDWCGQRLVPGGVCFVKDIATSSRWRVWFTKLLDDVMTGGDPVHYMSVPALRSALESRGLTTTVFHLWDYIPFPHVIYVARKQG